MTDNPNQEQLAKRVEWLDSERRNDKTVIASMQSKLDNLDTENNALRLRLAELESEITRLNTLMARLAQFEQDIAGIRTDTTRQVEDLKTSFMDKAIQTEKNSQEIATLNQTLTEVQKRAQDIDPLKDSVEERREEERRLAKLIEETRGELNDIQGFDEEYKRSLRIIEENRRQDAKRLTDIQGEVAAMRKRQDETRGKQDLVGDSIRKMENRIKELLAAESERREAQTAFVEKINLAQLERDRAFKDWAERFDEMERITTGLEKELADLEDTHRSVKQSQAGLDEVSQRFDRRINEITEIQRLNEDRFRQEWTTFKSDDQKRWSNYTISQEEQHREMNRNLETLATRLSTLEDHLTNVQDHIDQIGKEEVKRLTSLLATLRESAEVYQAIFKE